MPSKTEPKTTPKSNPRASPQTAHEVREISLTLIDPFPEHPFHVNDDSDMAQLAESIKVHGVLTPVIVRPKDNGRFELISGHRRKRACELAGVDTKLNISIKIFKKKRCGCR